MSVTPKKRRLERVSCQLMVTLRVGDSLQRQPAEILDLSKGGARVRCDKTIVHIGDRVEITVAGKYPLKVRAKVAYAEPLEFLIDEDNDEESKPSWSDDSSGVFGVKFLSLGVDEERQLRALLTSLVGEASDQEAA